MKLTDEIILLKSDMDNNIDNLSESIKYNSDNKSIDLSRSHLISDIQIYKNKKLISRDEYLNIIYSNLPFTRYHFYLILSIFLIRTVEGTEVLSISLASSMLEKNFKLKDNQIIYYNFLIFLGNFFGCLLSIIINDRYSRKILIIIGVTTIILFGFISILSISIWMFVISRHFVNIGIGLILASSTALITESVNINYRGFILNLILVSSAMGEFFISYSLGKFIILQNIYEWRKLFLISLCPVVCGMLLIPFFPDSFFYYITKKDYKEAIKIGKMYFNKFDKEENFTDIMNDNKDIIIDDSNENKCNYILILIIAFFNSFLLQGIKYILPKTLENIFNTTDNMLNLELQISSVLNGFCSFITGILIENSYLQRLRLMKVVILFSCVISYSAYCSKEMVDIFACILRSSISMHDQILEIFSAESFKTKYRVLFLGLYNIIQSISIFSSPLINDVIISYSYFLNYLVFGITLTILTLISIFLDKEKFKVLKY